MENGRLTCTPTLAVLDRSDLPAMPRLACGSGAPSGTLKTLSSQVTPYVALSANGRSCASAALAQASAPKVAAASAAERQSVQLKL